MNNLDKDYLALCQDILDNGSFKSDRTGTGTISVFSRHIRHNMSNGFPLLTTKKMSIKSIATELRWFLNGQTNIRPLILKGCNIWNGDVYKKYKTTFTIDKRTEILGLTNLGFVNGETQSNIIFTIDEFIDKIKNDVNFANKWGDLGPIYGKQWRRWATQSGVEIDQILNLINQIKNNPDSRRLMVNAWNVGDLDDMTLPPCHYGFQCYTRKLTHDELINYSSEFSDLEEKKLAFVKLQNYIKAAKIKKLQDELLKTLPNRKISLLFNMRSSDVALGLPYNIASYALLLTMIANEVNMIPDDLIGNLGDTHLYSNHIDEIKSQMGNKLSYDEQLDFEKDKILTNHVNWMENKKIWGIPKTDREPFPLPTLKMSGGIDSPLDGTDYELINYQSHSAIKFPLSN